MTVKECYEMMGGNYTDILGRLRDDSRIQRFALMFLNEASYDNLLKSLDEKNCKDAFRAAHTLKGVCQNLGFDRLYATASAITEELRAEHYDGLDGLLKQLAADYKVTYDAVEALKNSL